MKALKAILAILLMVFVVLVIVFSITGCARAPINNSDLYSANTSTAPIKISTNIDGMVLTKYNTPSSFYYNLYTLIDGDVTCYMVSNSISCVKGN